MHKSSITLSINVGFIVNNKGDSSNTLLQGMVGGVSWLTGSNRSSSLTWLILDTIEGLVGIVTVVAKDGSGVVDGTCVV